MRCHLILPLTLKREREGKIKKSENEINNGNPYAGLSNSHRRNVVKASFCLSARSARVKEAQVESCEYTKTKWVERFWLLLTTSGFHSTEYPPLYGSAFRLRLQEELTVGRLGFPSSSKHFVCRTSCCRLRLFSRLWYPPSFHSGVFPTAVINCFALYSEAGSLPRLKLRTAYVFHAFPRLLR